MQKFLLSLICAGLTGAILTGCETEAKKADAKPAPVAVSPAPAPAVAAKPAAATPAAVATGAIRIKAGSTTPVKDSAGNVFAAETGFEGGDSIERPDIAIANTKDAALYQAEHYGMSSFSIKVPNGKYIAKLHFCETYDGITAAGERVFSYNVQGTHLVKDFDVFAKAGGAMKAYVDTVPCEVTNGTFKIDFISNVENPEINAIELIPQS
jgi:hypothetical protein